eukprot:Platyproteum_vivax@DN2592_c0_g1_i1.p1
MAYFKKITTDVDNGEPGKQNAVIMGRKTWESVPAKFRPLKDRLNVVISSSLAAESVPSGVKVAKSLEEALSVVDVDSVADVFCIGGKQLYVCALEHPLLVRLLVTRIDSSFDNADTFFPQIPSSFKVTHSSEKASHKDIDYCFETYERTESGGDRETHPTRDN